MSIATARAIQGLVAAEYGVSVHQIKAHVRSNRLVIPRFVAIYLTHEMTWLTLKQIGHEFDRDHSTVIYACRQALARVDSKQLDSLRALIIEQTKGAAA